jgi:hypothetical protein
MRYLISAAIFWIILVGSYMTSEARVSFVHDRTLTVPQVASIEFMKIRPSVDGGSLLVLATDGAKLILYNASLDSVELQARADSGMLFDKIELADVTRDSVLDACALEYDSGFGIESSTEVVLDVYRSCDSLTRKSRVLDSNFQQGMSGFYGRPVGIGACDLDHDGYDELLASVGTMTAQMIGPCDEEWSVGKTYIFRSAPDSVRDSLTGTVTEAHKLSFGTGSKSYAVTTPSYSYSELGDDRLTKSTTINALTDSTLTIELAATRKYGTAWGCNWLGENDNYTTFGCTGNILVNDSNAQLLTRFDGRSFCSGAAVSASGSLLELRELQSPTQSTLLWSRDITGTHYTQFMYHPQLPGVFFGFSGDTLIMFSGSDGSIRDRLTDVPTGQRYWDYPYNDSIPRLVVINGTTVSLYHLDIATGVNDDNRNSALPHSFTLGNPYPNPFNPSTSIPVATGPGGRLTLEVYNIAGQRVATLYDGKVSANQAMICKWNTVEMASGVYFMRASLNGLTATKKLMLLK